MKRFLTFLLTSVLFLSFAVQAYAVSVHGYTRKNGTYVAPYERSAPDGNPYNNYSYPGNTNPYTGKTAGGNPDTYLNNYYNHSSGSGGSTYSYPSTPTCPLNSYYDSISSKCQCYAGYLVSGGQCVTNDQYCKNLYGYNSQYDYLKSSCGCGYGYQFSGGSCVSMDVSCNNQILGSTYNSISNTCDCAYGNSISGNQCVLNDVACQNLNGINSHAVYGTSKCLCNTGYYYDGQRCSLQVVNVPQANISPTVPNTIVNNGDSNTAAVLGATTYKFTRNLKFGMKGEDVQALQSILNDKGFMDWSKNTKIGTFDSTTKQGLIKYQKSVGIKATGILDAKTIASL